MALYLPLLVCRIVAFVFVFGFLPVRFLPFFVRWALALAMLIFSVPYFSSTSSFLPFAQMLLKLDGDQTSFALPRYTLMLGEAAIGALLAVSANAAIYMGQLLAGWFCTLLTGAQAEEFDRPVSHSGIVQHALMLAVLLVVFQLLNMEIIWTAFGRSLTQLPYLSYLQQGGELSLTAACKGVVWITVSMAFGIAWITILPAFLIALAVDLLLVLFRRYFQEAFSASLSPTVKIPVLLLVLTLTLYPFSEHLSRLVREGAKDSSIFPSAVRADSTSPGDSSDEGK